MRNCCLNIRKLTEKYTSFLSDESGGIAIEYALIATLIMMTCVAALSAVGDALLPRYSGISSLL